MHKPQLSKSQNDEMLKYIRKNNAAQLEKEFLGKYRSEMGKHLSSFKDHLTNMSMLRYSIFFKSFDVTSILMDYVGDDIFVKERYNDGGQASDPTVCTTFIHLLIDENLPDLIEKFWRIFQNNNNLLPYLALKKKCFVTTIEFNVDTVEYLPSLEYAAYKGQHGIIHLFCKYHPNLISQHKTCTNLLRYAIMGRFQDTFISALEIIRRLKPSWYTWQNWEVVLNCAVQCGFTAIVEECYKVMKAIDDRRSKQILPDILRISLNDKTMDTALMLLELNLKENGEVINGEKVFHIITELGLDKIAERVICLLPLYHDFEFIHKVTQTSLETAAQNEHQNIVKILFHLMKEKDIQVQESLWNIVATKGNDFRFVTFEEFNQTFESSRIVLSEGKLSALHIVSRCNCTRSVAFFRHHYVSFEIVDECNNTPFHAAAKSDAAEVVDYFIKQFANINAINKFKQTPLHLACSCLNLKTIKVMLLSKYTKLKKYDENNCTALHCYVQALVAKASIKVEQKDVLQQLCNVYHKRGALQVVNKDGKTAFDLLVDAGIESGIECFHHANFNADRTAESAMRQYKKKPGIIKTLLTVFENKPSGNELLQKLVDPSKLFYFSEPLYEDVRYTTALHVFATSLDESTVKQLLENKASILAIDEKGDTVLHVLATLSATSKSHEREYITLASVILSSYLQEIKPADGVLKEIRDRCRLFFVIATKIFVNWSGESVVIHAAHVRAVKYLEFLLQFDMNLAEEDEPADDKCKSNNDHYLFDCVTDITGICQETLTSLDDYAKTIADIQNFSAAILHKHFQTKNVTSSMTSLFEETQEENFLNSAIAIPASSASSSFLPSLVKGHSEPNLSPASASALESISMSALAVPMPASIVKFMPFKKTVKDADTPDGSIFVEISKNAPKHKPNKASIALLDSIVTLSVHAEDDCLRMLDIFPIKRIIDGYCQSYFKLYRMLLVIHLLVMIAFSCILIYSSGMNNDENECIKTNKQTLFAIIGTIIWVYGLTITIVRVILIFHYRHATLLPRLDRVLMIFSAFYLFVFTATTFAWWLCMLKCSSLQPYFLSVSIAMGWTLVLSYMQAFKDLHVFTNILIAVMTTNVISFMFVFAIFVIAMFCSLFAIVTYPPQLYNGTKLIYQSIYLTTNLDGFLDESVDVPTSARLIFAQFIYFSFTSFTAIILLNVLIAMMNDSYRRVVDREHLAWKIQSLRKTIFLKHKLPFIFTIRPFRSTFKSDVLSCQCNDVNFEMKAFSIKLTAKQMMKYEISQQINSMTAAEQELKSNIDDIRNQMMRLESKLDEALNKKEAPLKEQTHRVLSKWKAFAKISKRS